MGGDPQGPTVIRDQVDLLLASLQYAETFFMRMRPAESRCFADDALYRARDWYVGLRGGTRLTEGDACRCSRDGVATAVLRGGTQSPRR